ncbi:transposase [Seohaeicola saemankumensis]|uniref:transposase n=1 Tax=Seohaeicola TaxID=481178 RepID=UPI0035CF0BA4
MKKKANTYSSEARERAVQLVLGANSQTDSRWQTVILVAAKVGCAPQTLNAWVKKAEAANGQRAGIPNVMTQKMKALERENRELRQTNEVLREAASYYFALAQIDRPGS